MTRTVIYLTLICVLIFFVSANFGAPHGKDYLPRREVVIGRCITTMIEMTDMCNVACRMNLHYKYGYCDESKHCRCFT